MPKPTKAMPSIRLALHPRRSDEPLLMERQGDILLFNGTPLDLSTVTARKPKRRFEAGCDWLAGDVRRIKGVLHVSVLLPHAAAAPDETLYPGVISITQNGPVPLPPYEAPR